MLSLNNCNFIIYLHSTVVLLKGIPENRNAWHAGEFTFYCSSIKGAICYLPSDRHLSNLHSTVVLLKVRCLHDRVNRSENLHSTVVLLKVPMIAINYRHQVYLHSTVVLLKVSKCYSYLFNYIIIYILL